MQNKRFYDKCNNYLKQVNKKRTDVIINYDEPLTRNGTIAILKGNLSPECLVVKHSAIPRQMFNVVLKA